MKELLTRLRLLTRHALRKITQEPREFLLSFLLVLLFLLFVQYWLKCTDECLDVVVEIARQLGTTMEGNADFVICSTILKFIRALEGLQYESALTKLLHRTLVPNRMVLGSSLSWYCNDLYFTSIKYTLTGKVRRKVYGINTYDVAMVDITVRTTYRKRLSVPVTFITRNVLFEDLTLCELLNDVLLETLYDGSKNIWDIIRMVANQSKVFISFTLLEDILADIRR
ncbi:Hypothetical predicted protein [Paramuricea clavata]|uniref:Uncharacterized protein n=1 Tax=Paramuricea clavata TaxID=317549 RepID=A0A6S7HN94_PARCT|nr:Hypothetical predicted protein [Paramuricea clavata]